MDSKVVSVADQNIGGPGFALLCMGVNLLME